MFPFLKDMEYEITQFYWLVNLNKSIFNTIFLTAEKAWLPLIPPNLQPGNSNSQLTYGVNFASAGAGALVETFPGMVNIINFYYSILFENISL